jgi:hypothetical protein
VNALDQNVGQCGEVARRLDGGVGVAVRSRPVVVARPQNDVANLAASLPQCDVVPGPLRSGVLLRMVTTALLHKQETQSAAC